MKSLMHVSFFHLHGPVENMQQESVIIFWTFLLFPKKNYTHIFLDVNVTMTGECVRKPSKDTRAQQSREMG